MVQLAILVGEPDAVEPRMTLVRRDFRSPGQLAELREDVAAQIPKDLLRALSDDLRRVLTTPTTVSGGGEVTTHRLLGCGGRVWCRFDLTEERNDTGTLWKATCGIWESS